MVNQIALISLSWRWRELWTEDDQEDYRKLKHKRDYGPSPLSVSELRRMVELELALQKVREAQVACGACPEVFVRKG